MIIRFFLLFFIVSFFYPNTELRHIKSITSIINTTDLIIYNNKILSSSNGGLYDYNASALYVDNLSYHDIRTLTLDDKGRLWVGGNKPSGSIQILDSNLKLINFINYPEFNYNISKIVINNDFAFSLMFNDEINEYAIAQYSNLDNGLSSYVNMFNQFSDNYSEINDITLIGSLLYVATDNGLFYIDYEENFLIDADAWEHVYIDIDIKALLNVDSDIYLIYNNSIVDYSTETTLLNISMLNDYVGHKYTQDYLYILSSDSLLRINLDNYLDYSIIYVLNENLNTFCTSLEVDLETNLIYLGLYNHGIITIDNIESNHLMPNSIFKNSFEALDIINNKDLFGISKHGGFIIEDVFSKYEQISIKNFYSINEYIDNNYPLYDNNYYGQILPYISGSKTPRSIVVNNDDIYIPNTGLYPEIDFYPNYPDAILGSLLKINYEDSISIDEFWGSDVYDGLNGIYNSQWNTGYTVISQIKLDDYDNLWTINPYSEDGTNEPLIVKVNDTFINIEDNTNVSAYIPTEIAFDSYSNVWIAYQSENELGGDSDIIYSPGGIKMLNFQNFSNLELYSWSNFPLPELSNVNVWSLDIGSDKYGNDILWTLSDNGAMGYIIDIEYITSNVFNVNLQQINSYYYFSDIQFDASSKIRVDMNNNAWITTPSNGVKVIKSNGELWPDNTGINVDNSNLLSNSINDIVFDEYGYVYISTSSGISIFETIFAKTYNNSNISISPNPFILDGIESLTISNIPEGSVVQVMNLSGKVVKSFDLNYGTSIFNWDGKSDTGAFLSTGVYLIVSYHPNKGSKTGKLAIIR